MPYFEVSAKDGAGIDKMFHYLAVKKLGLVSETEHMNITGLDNNVPIRKSKCC